MGIQNFIRKLMPRSDRFFELLEKQAQVAHQAAEKVWVLAEGGAAYPEISEAVRALEHEGDRLVRELEEELAKTFVTPIDREDLQRLSVELDDIADLINVFTRSMGLYGVDAPSEAMGAMIAVLLKATEALATALPGLRRNQHPMLIDAARVVRHLEKDADDIYRAAISRLFQDDAVEAREIIRQKSLLDDLEEAVDKAEVLANTLATLAIKHA